MNKNILIWILFLSITITSALAQVDYVGIYEDRTSLGNSTFNSILYSSPKNYPIEGTIDLGYQNDTFTYYMPINTTIVDTVFETYSYGVTKGIYESYFKEPANSNELIKLRSKNDEGEVIVNETLIIEAVKMNYYNNITTETISNPRAVNATLNGSKITYENAYTTSNDVVDMEFIYNSNRLKEYLYLKNLNFSDPTLNNTEWLEFHNLIKFDELVLDIYADSDGDGNLAIETGNFIDGEIEFRRKTDNKTIWKLPKLEIEDSNSSISEGHYRVVRRENEIDLYVQVNWSWVNSSERVFPIVIDPTTSRDDALSLVVVDGYFLENNPSLWKGSEVQVYVESETGENKRGYWKFNFSSLGASSITNAEIYIQPKGSYSGLVVDFYLCNSTANSANWNTKDSAIIGCDGSPAFSESSFSADVYFAVNATSKALEKLGDDDSFSMYARANIEDTQSDDVQFDAKELDGNASDPYLNITYVVAGTVDSTTTSTSGTRNMVRVYNGSLYVAYVKIESVSGEPSIYVAESTDNGTSWTVMTGANPISATDDGSSRPTMAIDSNDIVHLAWSYTFETDSIQYSRYNGTWSTPIAVSTGYTKSWTSPSLTISSDGNMWLTSQAEDRSDTLDKMYYRNCSISADCTDITNWDTQLVRGYERSILGLSSSVDMNDYVESLASSPGGAATDRLIASYIFGSWLDITPTGLSDISISGASLATDTFSGSNIHFGVMNEWGDTAIYYLEKNTSWSSGVNIWDDVGGALYNPLIAQDANGTLHVLFSGKNSSYSNYQIFHLSCDGTCTSAGNWNKEVLNEDDAIVHVGINSRWSHNNMNGGLLDYNYRDSTSNYLMYDTLSVDAHGTPAVNTAPTIVSVSPDTSYDPVENANTPINISFIADDVDGVADLNDTSAQIVVSKDAVSHTSTSCTPANIDTTSTNYTCEITMDYYDDAGTWAVNASVQDNSAESVYNDTETFTYNTLKAIQLFNKPIAFGSISIGEGATSNNISTKNTGNVQYNVTFTGANLTYSSNIIPADDMKWDIDSNPSDGTNVSEVSQTVFVDTDGSDINYLWHYILVDEVGLPVGSYSGTFTYNAI